MPNWTDDIKQMFTQYDVVKMLDAGGLKLDLSKYEDVKKYARNIVLCVQFNDDSDMANVGWSKLPFVHIMPKYEAPWPSEKVETFQDWIDAGCPYSATGGPPPPTGHDAELELFIALSERLTGFDFLHKYPDLAQSYLTRLKKHLGSAQLPQYKSLLRLFEQIQTADDSVFKTTIVQEPTLRPLAQTIILLWYTSAFYKGRFPSDFGTPDDNQYRQGLVWQLAEAHPMGFSMEEQYWQHKPTPAANGQIQYTGLWPFGMS